PPQLSAAELKAQEDEATLTVQKIIVGAVLFSIRHRCCKEAILSAGSLRDSNWAYVLKPKAMPQLDRIICITRFLDWSGVLYHYRYASVLF
ncbi:hypothetical protein DH86_00002860, partial [Scytalidium sp. 3C]